ncbi:MAG TPA: glycosyltransferase family 1 protein [Vicinamibacterales bacterium]|nr:glycosyltransferase family 1 protein [Vicinamibacterales bacterium]
MRILLDYRPALSERTGVGEFVHELTRALARTGADDISVFTASWKDRPAADLPAELGNVRIVDWRLPVQGLTWSWNRLGWPPAEWLAGASDVVHSQSPLVIPARRAARVVTIHDLDFLLHPERAQAEMRRDFPALVRQHVHRADHVVVSSRYARGEVTSRLTLSHDKVTVCSPGAPAWAPDIARARSTLGTRGTLGTPGTPGTLGTLILFIGTIEPRKNISGLLDAYARLRERRPDAPPLVLAGRARNSSQRDLHRAQTPPLAGHVSALGYVSDAERRRLYREACMLVLPSLEEGFGLPVLEAMSCGVPVVISNRGSLPEVAGDAASPVDPADSDALAQEMERLLAPAAARAAAARGLTRAAAYSWDRCAASAREAYRAAVEHRRRHQR